jgi:hypothetical protein
MNDRRELGLRICLVPAQNLKVVGLLCTDKLAAAVKV